MSAPREKLRLAGKSSRIVWVNGKHFLVKLQRLRASGFAPAEDFRVRILILNIERLQLCRALQQLQRLSPMSRLPAIHLAELENALRIIRLELHQMLKSRQAVMPTSRGHERIDQTAERLNVIRIGAENLIKEARCLLVVSLSSFGPCLLQRRTLRHTFRSWHNKQADQTQKTRRQRNRANHVFALRGWACG